jgi:hypothetical protein
MVHRRRDRRRFDRLARLPQGVGADEEADLFTEFTGSGVLERLAVTHAAARSHPTTFLLDVHRVEKEFQEKHSLSAVQQDHPCRAALV